MSRKDKVARSITDAIIHPNEIAKRKWRNLIKALFTLYNVPLEQFAADDFNDLRQRWELETEDYHASFTPRSPGDTTALQPAGTMGYSGSTFFTTFDGKYLVKSVPRQFEHSFFKNDFLPTYVEYMGDHLDTLIIRIADFLAMEDVYRISPGYLLGMAPSHHMVMENLLVGKKEGEQYGKETLLRRNQGKKTKEMEEDWKWQTWDLKPTTYFFPERDIAGRKLTSEATKSRLADIFEDKLILTRVDADRFMRQLSEDTEILREGNAVDYSLFLVRIPVVEDVEDAPESSSNSKNPFTSVEDDEAEGVQETTSGPDLASTAPTPSKPPFTPPDPPSWRSGIKSADGKYVYRAAILDFFWAKHKLFAKVMTKLVKTWNRIDPGGSKGPMSITTNSKEYRERFLQMCEGFIEVIEEAAET